MKIVCCVDKKGKIVRTSKALLKITGMSQDSLRGACFASLFIKEDQQMLGLAMERAKREQAATVSAKISSVNGHDKSLDIHWQLSRAGSSNNTIWLGQTGCLQQSSSAPRATAHQSESLPLLLLQENLSNTLNQMTDGLVALDRNWVYTYVNQQACSLLNRSAEELVGKHIWRDVFPQKVGGKFYKDCMQALQNQQPVESINSYAPGNKWFVSRICPSREGLLVFFNDQTEKRASEQKAEMAQKKLQDFIAALDTSSIITVTNAEGVISWVNDNFCKNSRYSREEAIGQHLGFMNVQFELALSAEELFSRLSKGIIWKGEVCNSAKDGSLFWTYSTIVPFTNEGGELSHTITVCQDITERKKAAKALQESEKLYRSLIENHSNAVFVTNLKGDITFFNSHALALTGKSEGELKGSSLLAFLSADARSQLSTGLPAILQGKKMYIRAKVQHFLTAFFASISIAPIMEESRICGFFFKFRDISKKVDYEKDLALLNDTSRALSSAPDLEEGMAVVIQLLCQYTDFQYGEFWMPLLGQTTTRMKAYWEAGKDYRPVTADAITRTWDMRSEKKHLFGTGTFCFIPSIRESDKIRRKEIALACGLGSFLSIPIMYRNKMLGVIGLWGTEDKKNLSFNPSHLQSLMDKLGGELERRQNNEEFRKFFKLTPDLLCIIGFDDQPKKSNPAFESLLGYTKEEIETLRVSDLVHPDDRTKSKVALEKGIQGEGCQNLAVRVRCKDGSYRWLSVSTQPSLTDGLIYLVGRDITEQKKQLEEIERIKIAIENTTDAIGIAASAEETVYTNPAFMEIFCWDVAPMNANGGPRGLFVDSSLPDIILATLANEGRWEGDIEMYDGYGKIREVNLRADAILDEQGNFKYLIGIFVDIAEKNKAELEIKKLSKAVDESGNEVYIIDTNTRRFSYINNKGLENLGYSRQEIPYISPLDVNPDYDRLSYKKLFHPLLMGQEKSLTYQTTHKRKDDSQYPVEVYLTLFRHGQNTSIMAHAIDITERKQSEEELRMINERYLLVTKATRDAIWDWDIISNNVYYGDAYETLFGLDPSKASYDYWVDKIHPDDRERVVGNIMDMATNQKSEWTIDYRFRCADGSHKFVKDRGYVIRDAEGKAIRMTGAVSDISEQRKNEELLKQFNTELEAKVTQKTARLATTLTKMQQEMLAREQVEYNLHQSLQEKDVLLKEIHHRVKNNMAIISGLLSLQARHSQQNEVKTLFRESQQRIRSMALIHELLYQHRNLSRINFQKYIQELTSGISHSFSSSEKNVSIEINADGADMDIVQAVPCGLILNELITNCYKYAFREKQAGIIRVDFKHTDGYYSLQVIDNGQGLPSSFNSSQSKTLGLQLVHSLVRQLGGTLENSSQNGAKFMINFKDNSNS